MSNSGMTGRNLLSGVWVACALLAAPAAATGLSPDPSGRGAKPVPGQTLVILGASYANNWDIGTLGPYRVINKGVGGEETRHLLARFERDVIGEKPAAVLIWCGVNDIFRAPRDAIADRQSKIRENLQAMVDRAARAGVRPILATEVLMASPDRMSATVMGWLGKLRGKQSYADYINDNVRAANRWIREFGQARGILVLDFEQALAGEDGRRQSRYATEDGSHLTPAAYSALTEYAVGVFRKGTSR